MSNMSFIKKSATDKRTPPIKAPRLQSGLSLVELMVSITLGLLIMAGVVQLFASSSTSSQTVQASARIQENIRYIMTRIGNDIAQAGNLGCYSSSVASSVKGSYKNQLDAPSVLTLTNIIVPPSIFSNFASPFASGTDGSPGGVLPDTDTLMVNYVDHGAEIPLLKAGTTGAVFQVSDVDDIDGTNGADVVAMGDIVYAGNCQKAIVSAITDITGDLVTVQANHNIADVFDSSLAYLYAGNTGGHRYFIDTSARAGNAIPAQVCAAATPQYCALFRDSNNTGQQELIEGVEDLQISYSAANADDDGNDVNRVTSTSPNLAAPGLTAADIDRVSVTMRFNAVDKSFAGGRITKTVTRVFAVRTQR